MAGLLLSQEASALVSIDDRKNQLFVNANVTYTWDSNIYSIRDGASDGIYSASVGVEVIRRAGLIGVNGSVNLDVSSFVENAEENFQNPRFSLEFTKQSGRTTGSLLLSAARQSRADSAANLRSESWIYETGLNLKYPVIERYSLSGGVGYSLRDFKDNSMLVDLATYSANLDLFYVYNTERDLIAGYRIRYGETSARNSFFDHAFTVGVSGKVLPKLSGTFRIGYQIRVPNNSIDESHNSLTVTSGVSWNLSKKTKIGLNLSKDFTTTSTNATVDATSIMLHAQHAVNSKVSLSVGGSYGINRFLGRAGGGRIDEFVTFDVGVNYAILRELLTLNAGYSYLYNWSNFRFSNFERNSITVSASTRF
ncbi:MAG: outer membrane beta-barrel protein [Opitutaceae bacterium]|nr:outer membrane beta-barrel protein [Opitutaceae bacterium]